MTMESTQVKQAEAALPLFYKDPVLLRFEKRDDVGVSPASGFDFAREAVANPICNGVHRPTRKDGDQTLIVKTANRQSTQRCNSRPVLRASSPSPVGSRTNSSKNLHFFGAVQFLLMWVQDEPHFLRHSPLKTSDRMIGHARTAEAGKPALGVGDEL